MELTFSYSYKVQYKMEETALNTLKGILTARGYNGETFEPVTSPLGETMYTFDGVLIIFSSKTRVSEQNLTTFITFASENGYSSGMIIVSPSRSSDSVLSVLRKYISNKENPLVQIFDIRHLQFDISKHRKVPKHRILKSDEIEDILKEYNLISPTGMPKIDSQDPMAKWIGARPGDVVEVIGLCETSAENRRYRYCVADVTNE